MQEKIIKEVKELLKNTLNGKFEFSICYREYTDGYEIRVKNEDCVNIIILQREKLILSFNFSGDIDYSLPELDYLEIKQLFLKLSNKYITDVYNKLCKINNSIKDFSCDEPLKI